MDLEEQKKKREEKGEIHIAFSDLSPKRRQEESSIFLLWSGTGRMGKEDRTSELGSHRGEAKVRRDILSKQKLK